MEVVSSGFGENLAYDLRQRYAKIVGDHLEDVALARKNNNYSDYFKALDDLYTVVRHKFQVDKKDKEGKEEDKYLELKNECIKVANDNISSWSGKASIPNQISLIEKALRAIEMYLYFKMDEANMFGSKRDTEGLV